MVVGWLVVGGVVVGELLSLLVAEVILSKMNPVLIRNFLPNKAASTSVEDTDSSTQITTKKSPNRKKPLRKRRKKRRREPSVSEEETSDSSSSRLAYSHRVDNEEIFQ